MTSHTPGPISRRASSKIFSARLAGALDAQRDARGAFFFYLYGVVLISAAVIVLGLAARGLPPLGPTPVPDRPGLEHPQGQALTPAFDSISHGITREEVEKGRAANKAAEQQAQGRRALSTFLCVLLLFLILKRRNALWSGWGLIGLPLTVAMGGWAGAFTAMAPVAFATTLPPGARPAKTVDAPTALAAGISLVTGSFWGTALVYLADKGLPVFWGRLSPEAQTKILDTPKNAHRAAKESLSRISVPNLGVRAGARAFWNNTKQFTEDTVLSDPPKQGKTEKPHQHVVIREAEPGYSLMWACIFWIYSSISVILLSICIFVILMAFLSIFLIPAGSIGLGIAVLMAGVLFVAAIEAWWGLIVPHAGLLFSAMTYFENPEYPDKMGAPIFWIIFSSLIFIQAASCIFYAFSVREKKNREDTDGWLVFFAGLYGLLGGVILGMIPVAILKMKPTLDRGGGDNVQR